MDSLSLLQGIFPTQGSNPGLPQGRQILYQLSHKGSIHTHTHTHTHPTHTQPVYLSQCVCIRTCACLSLGQKLRSRSWSRGTFSMHNAVCPCVSISSETDTTQKPDLGPGRAHGALAPPIQLDGCLSWFPWCSASGHPTGNPCGSLDSGQDKGRSD